MPVTVPIVTQELNILFGGNPTFMSDEHRNLFIEIACFLGNASDPKLRKRLITALPRATRSARACRERSTSPRRGSARNSPT